MADTESVRQRSTIEFPYLDLDDALGIARGIHEVGGSACNVETLAGHLKQAPNGGGFRLRLISSRIYGLTRYGKGEIALTELGTRVSDPIQEKSAKVEAFLNVPLYKALYDRFRGTVLPPPSGIENTIVMLGVPPKQKDKARQTFMRAARQAGFFDFGNERLIMPAMKEDSVSQPTSSPSPERPAMETSSERYQRAFHPFVEGLLQKLPVPEAVWSRGDRQRWLQTAANIFDLMYAAPPDEAAQSITVSIS